MTNAKPIPKSLHTVTVLWAVAADIRAHAHGETSDELCVSEALDLLGYRNADDPHGIIPATLSRMRGA